MCNFANDTTPYVCNEKLQQVMTRLEHDSEIAICWFENNYMKLNTILIYGHKYEHIWAKIGNDTISESSIVKLLGITIDSQLKFNEHVLNICKKNQQKAICFIQNEKVFKF